MKLKKVKWTPLNHCFYKWSWLRASKEMLYLFEYFYPPHPNVQVPQNPSLRKSAMLIQIQWKKIKPGWCQGWDQVIKIVRKVRGGRNKSGEWLIRLICMISVQVWGSDQCRRVGLELGVYHYLLCKVFVWNWLTIIIGQCVRLLGMDNIVMNITVITVDYEWLCWSMQGVYKEEEENVVNVRMMMEVN